jgi:hypothetical protein
MTQLYIEALHSSPSFFNPFAWTTILISSYRVFEIFFFLWDFATKILWSALFLLIFHSLPEHHANKTGRSGNTASLSYIHVQLLSSELCWKDFNTFNICYFVTICCSHGYHYDSKCTCHCFVLKPFLFSIYCITLTIN